MPTSSKAVGITRSVTFNVTAGAAKVLSFEPATPYSTCIESQHSQPGSGLSNQVSKNNAMWSYLRYSFIFFIAMVATWLPSFVNRVYSLVNHSNPNFGLNLTGAFVLSLQGFWNAIIYTSTTFPILKAQWASILKSLKSFSPLRSTRRVTRRESADISLQGAGFDGRSNTGSTSSLAIRPSVETSVAVSSNV
ncbi:hypothetical protein PENARI_c002G00321 [Penicillium arizonense]|uniref:Uncharacterized protein n=1 Tax=Penicillium arizonense TaxID=1835702 RepID=A0A1F5LWR1_PENAI|nr:hypothetical protein PENARI_c002G00321 [Penicillium arizonense]OGE57580.1 hypothetical protein PENARI_c002G00321 [Penicillium arizonense]